MSNGLVNLASRLAGQSAGFESFSKGAWRLTIRSFLSRSFSFSFTSCGADPRHSSQFRPLLPSRSANRPSTTFPVATGPSCSTVSRVSALMCVLASPIPPVASETRERERRAELAVSTPLHSQASGEGTHFLVPWLQRAILYDCRIKPRVSARRTSSRARREAETDGQFAPVIWLVCPSPEHQHHHWLQR